MQLARNRRLGATDPGCSGAGVGWIFDRRRPQSTGLLLLNPNNGVCSTGCALEGGYFQGAACPANSNEGTVFLEGERTANILFRVDHGEVMRVRLFSPTCQIGYQGDLTLHWLTVACGPATALRS